MEAETRETREPVVVIGAGIAGCMAAIYLAESGYQVTLIEKESELMLVSSKIPVHLHSGGLYIKDNLDMAEAFDCLRDSINFMKAMSSFAVVNSRPTAFAIIMPSDNPKDKLPNKETPLADEAIDLYCKEKNKDREKDLVTSETLGEELEAYKEKIRERQRQRWETLKKGFEQLKSKYQEIIDEDLDNTVFGVPEDFFETYSSEEFKTLKTSTSASIHEPKSKKDWAQNLALVTDPNTVVGVIISSELGLNMFQTRAVLEKKINDLEKQQKLFKLLKCEATKIEKITGQSTQSIKFEVTFTDENKQVQILHFSQVVNAAGYLARDFDLSMGYKGKWSVDMKGAGIITIQEGPFQCIPEVYFTQAKGLCHFSSLNKKLAGINYTSPHYEGTYVSEGKTTLSETEDVASKTEISTLKKNFLDIGITDEKLLARTRICITGCSQFMPMLGEYVTAIAFLPGALGIPGNLTDRHSHYVHFSENGYHSINIVKGGAAVSTAMVLVEIIESHSKSEQPKDSSTVIKSPLKAQFVISFDPKALEEILTTSFENSHIGQTYSKASSPQ